MLMKKFLLFIAVIVVVIVGGVTALVTLVNPNQFKPLIVEQVKQHTGLDLKIDGDIHWQFFPSIGFELGKTALSNPSGFSQPTMFKVNQVGVSVSVLPLFSHQLQIGNVTLDGAEVNVETLKDGRRNIDALLKPKAVPLENPQTKASVKPSTEEKAASNNAELTSDSQTTAPVKWKINLAGVTISDAKLVINDRKAGTETKLDNVAANLTGLMPNEWATARFSAEGQSNQQVFAVKGGLKLRLSGDMSQYALKDIDVTANLKAPDMDLKTVKLALSTFEFDKENTFTYSLLGQASGTNFDLQGGGILSVDHQVSRVAISGFNLTGKLSGAALPSSPMKLNLKTDVSFNLSDQQLALTLEKLQANDMVFSGNANVTLAKILKVRFKLHSPEVNLDKFLASKAAQANASAGGKSVGSAGTAAETSKPLASADNSVPAAVIKEPDLSALKTVDVKGSVSIDKFQANNAKMQNVLAKISVNRGVAKLDAFSANLYSGSIAASAMLDGRQTPARYSSKGKITGVHVQPLLKDVANNNMLEGTGNIDFDIHGKGLTPTAIKRNLAGPVVIKFSDGAFNGINVAQLIRVNYAKLKGQPVDQAETAQKTDFSALTATIKLAKGVATTDDFTMQSPLLRIHGQGWANYINETTDFTVRTSIVGSLKGQGGKTINDLKDVTIPVKITGSWYAPKYKVVLDDVMKQKAKKELNRGLDKLNKKLGDKISDEKTQKAVDKLLNRFLN